MDFRQCIPEDPATYCFQTEPMNKQIELKRTKQLALLLLCCAAAIFILTLFCTPGLWRDGVKAVAEAAMVGAMADWFAVVALFKRVPIPFIAPHTAIIPRNQVKIADNLALFMQEKFLDTSSITALLKKHDPARMICDWLMVETNNRLVGNAIAQVMRGFLNLADDARIQVFFRRAVHAALDKMDLSLSLAALLQSLTKDGRHQELLDSALKSVVRQVNRPAARRYIAERIISWLKREHTLKEKMLPTKWLGEQGAVMAADALNSLLEEIGQDRNHVLRQHVDRMAARVIDRLMHDPAAAVKADEIKSYLKNDPALNTYLGELWGDLLGWLKTDLARPRSLIHEKVVIASQWFGQTLAHDPHLRASLNQHIEQAARKLAPDFAAFLSGHISDTVKSWDARDMSRQIELNIGKDLQYIRVNGTVVGGFIGLALYLLSLLPGIVRAMPFISG